MNATRRAWAVLSPVPGGRKVFSRLVCLKAPYFASIRPTVLALAPGTCTVEVRKRRRVLNHLGTVHAIACCNAAEIAAGLATDALVPASTHRWIPRGMTVQYLAKARTDITARAVVDLATAPGPGPFGDEPVDVAVPVEIRDRDGRLVVTATIDIRIGPVRRPDPAPSDPGGPR